MIKKCSILKEDINMERIYDIMIALRLGLVFSAWCLLLHL
jgi:hypothetical protein